MSSVGFIDLKTILDLFFKKWLEKRPIRYIWKFCKGVKKGIIAKHDPFSWTVNLKGPKRSQTEVRSQTKWKLSTKKPSYIYSIKKNLAKGSDIRHFSKGVNTAIFGNFAKGLTRQSGQKLDTNVRTPLVKLWHQP